MKNINTYINEHLCVESEYNENYTNIAGEFSFYIDEHLMWKKIDYSDWLTGYKDAYVLQNINKTDFVTPFGIYRSRVKQLFNDVIKGKLIRPAKKLGLKNLKVSFLHGHEICFSGIPYDKLEEFFELFFSLDWPFEWTKQDFSDLLGIMAPSLFKEKGFGSRSNPWVLTPTSEFNNILNKFNVKDEKLPS